MKIISKPIQLLGISCILIFLGVGCGKNKSVDTDTSELKITFVEKGAGRKVNIGDILRLHLAYKNPDGQTIFDSQILENEFVIEATKSTFPGSIEEYFLLLNEGDSAHFFVSADSVYKYTFGESLPASLKPGDQLEIILRLEKLYDPNEFESENERRKIQQIENESREIEIYLLNNALPVQAVKPGVYFFELKKGSGPKPLVGDSVYIRYTGRFLSGEVFDGSTQPGSELLSYRHGNGERLMEWERAISTMHEGSVARLILCSPHAYGRSGSGSIPGNTPLIYDIELIRIRSTKSL